MAKDKTINVDEMKIRDAIRSGFARGIYNALRSGSMNFDGARAWNVDSVQSVATYFARQLEYIEAQVYKILYPKMNALNLFPVTTDASPGHATYTFRSYGYVGKAKVTANDADDIPAVGTENNETQVPIRSILDSYSYTQQEALESIVSGMPLEAQRAEAARYAIELAVNETAWAGDTVNGLRGVFSPESLIPIFALAPGSSLGTSWNSKNGEEILNDVIAMRQAVIANSNGVEAPDTLALPETSLTNLARPMAIGGTPISTSIGGYLRQELPWLKNIVGVNELEPISYETNIFSTPAAQSGTALLFTKDERKLKIEMPMDFNIQPPQFDNLSVKFICKARTAAAIVYYPASALIVTGI